MIYSCYSRGKDLMTYESQSRMARKLLRIGLINEYGIIEEEVIRNISGKPSLKENREIMISIAHCTHAVTVILSRNRVGIDIENLRKFDAYAAKRILSDEEQEVLERHGSLDEDFFRYWTLKESYIKALGCGFSYPVKKFKIAGFRDKIITNRPSAAFTILDGTEGFITSVCLLRGSDASDEELREIKTTIP